MSVGSKRRTSRERRGERKRFKPGDWEGLFPRETEMATTSARVRPKIERKAAEDPKAQEVGRAIEEKVEKALDSLIAKGEIRGYLRTNKFGIADLLLGIDFYIIYVGHFRYCVCPFSVTGRKWLKRDLKKHPEIRAFSVYLNEKQKSIEGKILALKNSNNH